MFGQHVRGKKFQGVDRKSRLQGEPFLGVQACQGVVWVHHIIPLRWYTSDAPQVKWATEFC